METSVKKCKNFTSLEQSKKLAEILPIESADHHYVRKICDFMGNPVDCKWSVPKYGNTQSSFANYMVQNFTSYEVIPCWSLAALLNLFWSLAALLNILSKRAHSIDEDATVILSSHKNIEWNLSISNSGLEAVTKSDPVDACVEMIYKLKERNLL